MGRGGRMPEGDQINPASKLLPGASCQEYFISGEAEHLWEPTEQVIRIWESEHDDEWRFQTSKQIQACNVAVWKGSEKAIETVKVIWLTSEQTLIVGASWHHSYATIYLPNKHIISFITSPQSWWPLSWQLHIFASYFLPSKPQGRGMRKVLKIWREMYVENKKSLCTELNHWSIKLSIVSYNWQQLSGFLGKGLPYYLRPDPFLRGDAWNWTADLLHSKQVVCHWARANIWRGSSYKAGCSLLCPSDIVQ